MVTVDIKDNQRVAYIGKTGSGKTYLAEHVLAPIPRLIVLDGKASLGGKSWNLEQGARIERQLRAGHPGRLRVLGVTPDDWIPALELAWAIRNVVVYIDEMSLVNPGTTPSRQLARLYQIGRELKIGVHASTQRPRNVPAVMFSEADWIFLFRMSRAEDRKTVADYGDEYGSMRNAIHDPYGFYAYTPSWRKAIYEKRYVGTKPTRITSGERIPLKGRAV